MDGLIAKLNRSSIDYQEANSFLLCTRLREHLEVSLMSRSLSVPHCRRRHLLCLIAFVSCAGTSQSIWASNANDRVAAALATKSSYDFANASLHSVSDALAKEFGVRVRLDFDALDEAGIDRDTPVTCQFSNISLRAALSLMLEPVGLTYVSHNASLLITTRERAQVRLAVRYYAVSDLVSIQEKGRRSIDFKPLTKTIRTVIEPESWSELGGAGTVRGFAPSEAVVVNQTEKVHEKISNLLAALRNVTPVAVEGNQRALSDHSDWSSANSSSGKRVSLELTGKTLVDAVANLAQAFDVQIAIDRQALDEMGITTNSRIQNDLKDGRLADAVFEVLMPLGLSLISEHEVLVLTALERSEEMLVPRLYSVKDLATYRASDGTIRHEYDPLIGLITDAIQPESWEDLGGPGSIVAFSARHCLVVSQTSEVHREIKKLISELRRLRQDRPSDAGVASDRTTLEIYNITATGIESNTAVELITELVEPESWQGAKDVYIKPLPGRLLIQHHRHTHKRIRDLLRKLEPDEATGRF